MWSKGHILLLIALIFGTSTLFSATGSITGVIVDKETGLSLPGASVEIKDLNIGAVSNNRGEFNMINVPAGSVNIQVRYIGYQTVDQTVEVTDNSTLSLRIEMESGVVMGDEVVVVGDALKGQAKALNQQRNAINISNIVSADQVGRFPDANVGDALKRIPGITIQNDQGEARFGLVRGTAARLNTVMVNGDRIPSAEAENREVQLDLIPADMINQIEVSKVLTPDMDADAIGGAINLTTRPPSRQRLSLTVGGLYNGLSGQVAPNFSLIAGDRFMNDKLGVVLSATVFDHQLGSDNVEFEWDQVENAAGEDVAFVNEYDQRVYNIRRVRRSVSLGTDYQFNANNRIYLNGIYNWRDDWENRYRLRVRDIEYDPDTGEATYERVVRQTKGGINSDRVQNARLEDQRVFNLGFGGEHLIANTINFTWQGNYAEASEHRPNERYADYLYEVEDEEGDRIGIPLTNYDFSDPRRPFASGVNPDGGALTPGDFSLDAITEEEQDTKDTDFNFRMDFELPVISTGDYTSKLKFGGRLRTKEKYRSNNFFEYSPTDAGEALVNRLSDIENADQSDPDYLAGEEYQAGIFATKEALGNLDLENSDLFEKEDKLDEYAGGNFDATEEIIGAYAMYTQNIGSRFTVLGGLRLEMTNNEYTGRQFNEDEDYNSLADVPTETFTTDYSNILLNLQTKYKITEDFFARAAFSQSLARPNYFDLVPYQIIVPDDDEIEIGNPDLEPTVSNNFDILLDYYFENIGIISGGFFYKDIQNFTFNYTDEQSPEFAGRTWDALSQPRNGTEASLVGFEIAFQRQLDFLPSFLKNLSLYLNYTNTSSDATIEFGQDSDGNPETRDIALPGTAENMFNASLAYEDKYFTVRVAANYASDYIDELGSNAFNDRYYDEQFFLDANLNVRFYEGFQFFIEANNLTDQPLRYYQGTQDQTMQVEFYSFRINTGFKYDF